MIPEYLTPYFDGGIEEKINERKFSDSTLARDLDAKAKGTANKKVTLTKEKTEPIDHTLFMDIWKPEYTLYSILNGKKDNVDDDVRHHFNVCLMVLTSIMYRIKYASSQTQRIFANMKNVYEKDETTGDYPPLYVYRGSGAFNQEILKDKKSILPKQGILFTSSKYFENTTKNLSTGRTMDDYFMWVDNAYDGITKPSLFKVLCNIFGYSNYNRPKDQEYVSKYDVMKDVTKAKLILDEMKNFAIPNEIEIKSLSDDSMLELKDIYQKHLLAISMYMLVEGKGLLHVPKK